MCSSKTLSKLRIKTKELNYLDHETAKEHERKVVSLVSALTDMVLVLDENGVIKYANPSSQRVLGYNPEDLVGFSFAEMISSEICIFEYVDKHIGYKLKNKDGQWVNTQLYIGEMSVLTLHLYIVIIKGEDS